MNSNSSWMEYYETGRFPVDLTVKVPAMPAVQAQKLVRERKAQFEGYRAHKR